MGTNARYRFPYPQRIAASLWPLCSRVGRIIEPSYFRSIMKLLLQQDQRISSLWEAEQHVYSIPAAGVMPSRPWTSLTTERRVGLRSHAIGIWKKYLENENALVPHPPILIPEYRQMLTHPDGDLIVEEV
jgi:hypothetical protein